MYCLAQLYWWTLPSLNPPLPSLALSTSDREKEYFIPNKGGKEKKRFGKQRETNGAQKWNKRNSRICRSLRRVVVGSWDRGIEGSRGTKANSRGVGGSE